VIMETASGLGTVVLSLVCSLVSRASVAGFKKLVPHTNAMADQADADDVWESASAKQIRALGNVEKVRCLLCVP
jgi:hypothetical protein